MTTNRAWLAFELMVGISATVFFMSVAPVAAQYLVNGNRHSTYWATYEAIEPVEQQVFDLEGVVQMQSVAHVDRPLDVHHHDALYCVDSRTTRLRFVSEQRVMVRFIGPTLIGDGHRPDGSDDWERRDGQWEYAGRLPSEPSKCQMISSPTWRPSIGVEKRQRLKSQFFWIGPIRET